MWVLRAKLQGLGSGLEESPKHLNTSCGHSRLKTRSANGIMVTAKQCNNQHERINISNEHTGTSMITGAGSLLPPTQVTVYLRRQNDDGKSQGHTATRLSATPSNEPEALNPKPPVIPSPKALNLNSALKLN